MDILIVCYVNALQIECLVAGMYQILIWINCVISKRYLLYSNNDTYIVSHQNHFRYRIDALHIFLEFFVRNVYLLLRYGIYAGPIQQVEGCQLANNTCEVIYVSNSDPSQPCITTTTQAPTTTGADTPAAK